MRVGIVGFGRSGTTIVRNMIENFFSQENRKDTVFADHWYNRRGKNENEIF